MMVAFCSLLNAHLPAGLGQLRKMSLKVLSGAVRPTTPPSWVGQAPRQRLSGKAKAAGMPG